MLNLVMIFFAKYLYLLIVLTGILFISIRFWNKKKDALIFAIFSLPLTLIFAKISSYFFYDTRPFVAKHFTPLLQHAADNGFPSDHALLSFAIASVVFFFNKKLGIVLFIFGVIVGISRVYVGVHNPLDIFGSFLISILVSYCIYYLFKLYFPQFLENKEKI